VASITRLSLSITSYNKSGPLLAAWQRALTIELIGREFVVRSIRADSGSEFSNSGMEPLPF
jgi:hypothetical protein